MRGSVQGGERDSFSSNLLVIGDAPEGYPLVQDLEG